MLKNKTALITGGTKGIGFSIAEALLNEGIHVCITGRSQSGIDQALSQIKNNTKASIIGMVCDVRDFTQQQAVVDKTVSTFGSIDYLIANAGIGHFAPIDQLNIEQWNETIDVNLTGVFYSIKSALDALKKSKGYFITIASLAGTNFFANGSAYNASKFGLVGFTQAVMLDIRKHGIKATTIMPGSVSTYFNNHTPNDADSWKIQPEDLGQIVVDLIKLPARTLPSKIEVRPSIPPSAR